MRAAYSYKRWSDQHQGKGDSLKRQTSDAARACAEHKWKPSPIPFVDKGVSAFRGKNRKKGKLAAFLRMLEAGQLEKDAVLILEDFDRLSRDKIVPSFDLVRRILEGGIDIFCTLNWRLYTAASLEEPMSIMEMLWRFYLAHEEAVKRSKRSKANWQTKRERVEKAKAEKGPRKAMTATRPAWLRVEGKRVEGGRVVDSGRFVVIPERAQVVKNIFKWCIEGMGVWSIVRRLVKEGVPAWKTAWGERQVYRILSDRRACGELPCHEYGDTVKRAEVIKDYYPRIVSEETYKKAVVAIGSRKGKSGRRGTFVNLFQGIVYLPEHKSSMFLRSKIKPDGALRYLVSTEGFRGNGEYVSFRYDRFENAILRWLYELPASEFAPREVDEVDDASEVKFLDGRIQELAASLATVGTPVPEVMRMISDLEAKRSAAKKRIEEKRQRQAAPTVAETQELLTMLANAKGDDHRALRERIRQRLVGLGLRIDVMKVDGKRVFCTIHFDDGRKRGVWFDDKDHGLWSPDGTVDLKDVWQAARQDTVIRFEGEWQAAHG